LQAGFEGVRACTPEQAFEKSALVLQASALGMGWSSEHPLWQGALDRAKTCLKGVAPGAVLMDLVYTPRRTPWICAAESLGLESDHGLAMLVAQAAASFELWTGFRPDLDAMRRALSELSA